MPIIPVRGLASKGILRDPSAYQLDLDAWSNGSNVRFHANKAERAPIWRTLLDTLDEAPTFCVGVEPISEGYDSVFFVGADGRLWSYGAGTLTEVTDAGQTPTTDPRAVTSTFLGQVLYVNRPDGPPRYFGPASTQFAVLPNMETTWTARVLRAFGDYLIALNVTKPETFVDPHTGLTLNGGAFPNLIKWSNLTLEGQVPDSWDPDDPTKSTGENPLEQLNTPIVDGCVMRSIFVVYSENQIWGMEEVDNNEIFLFTQLFSEGGLLAPNCAVEVGGIHYCFGPKDIYRHDGVNKVSIVDKRNRETVYRWLNKQKSEVCFAAYMPQYDSVVFAYNTGDPNAAFPGTKCDRCNYALVYDISADTCSFIDLPNVSSMTQSNLDTIYSYESVPATVTYDNVGGSYYDQANTFVKNVVGCSGAVSGLFTQSRLLAYDFSDKGNLTLSANVECNAPAFLERTGIALDTEGSDLTTYKLVRRIYPLINVFNSVPVSIQVGGSETPGSNPTYLPAITFDPTTDYKIDLMKGGRYLAIRFTVSTLDDFEVAGYDLDVTNAGRR